MAIGMGACTAGTYTVDGKINGELHSAGIGASDFHGASGRVLFQESPVFGGPPGTRNATSAMYGAFNLLPPDKDVPYVLTDLFDPTGNSITVRSMRDNLTNISDVDVASWTSIQDFVFRNNQTIAPELLRDEGYHNYLEDGLQILGLTLFSITALMCLASAIWIIINRNHAVLRAAQPQFLLPICLGSLLQASCLLMISFDESDGLSVETLSRLCVAIPWCFIMGSNITYCALFGKLWRVNKVLQFRRVTIQTWKVLIPAFILFLVSLVVLLLFSLLTDYGWQRVIVDDFSGESMGFCASSDATAKPWSWFTAVLITSGLPILFALTMAWKTKDVEDSFSESWWIFSMVFVQLQALIVGIPLVAMLKKTSTNGRYVGITLLMWTISTSSVVLIMLPKVLAFYNIYGAKTAQRGARHGTRVTGIGQEHGSNGAQSLLSNGRPSGVSSGWGRSKGSEAHSDLEAISESPNNGDAGNTAPDAATIDLEKDGRVDSQEVGSDSCPDSAKEGVTTISVS
mmetsp:Transcript_15169/g.26287  ORF Transcript_15169/g.26287 Transcript_15169/m.26287 type:complete len:514 (+) Transcript_15169:1-1542(+)